MIIRILNFVILLFIFAEVAIVDSLFKALEDRIVKS